MKKQQQAFLIIAIVTIVTISLGTNIYFFANKWLKNDRQGYFNAGAVQLRETIHRTAIQNGFVIIANVKGETIRLDFNN